MLARSVRFASVNATGTRRHAVLGTLGHAYLMLAYVRPRSSHQVVDARRIVDRFASPIRCVGIGRDGERRMSIV